MQTIEKSFEECLNFYDIAAFYLNKKQERNKESGRNTETKFEYSLKKVAPQIERIIEDYKMFVADVEDRFALVDDKGIKLLDSKGRVAFAKGVELQVRQALKKLYTEKQLELHLIRPHIATSLEGHELTESEIDALKDFVI